MRPLLVLNVVGLTPSLIGADTPNLQSLMARGGMRPLRTVMPAVTCTVQSTFLTGLPPSGHGIVGNGWYFRDLSEIWFWRQSNRLVAGEKLWESARAIDPGFTCANLFWWYDMYSSADIAVTPRPMYPADGRKIPDIYTTPVKLRDELNSRLGTFPLFNFWGPRADIVSSLWIADCARHIVDSRRPTLTLVYLPHLDYSLQRLGPDDPRIAADVRAIDALCGQLIDCADRHGAAIVVLSEYGITPVDRPVHINRALRAAGLLSIREELGRELLDAGASTAFAVADHQVAHIYVNRPDRISQVMKIAESLPGVEKVLDAQSKALHGLDHPRAGELVAISDARSWFTYYYWQDDARAPDFARTVDIHRKPGYDPVELFIDPAMAMPVASIAWRLMKKKLGFRTLMDVIPLDATLVRGSHGRLSDNADRGPLFMSSERDLLPNGAIDASAVRDLLLAHVFGKSLAGEAAVGVSSS
jgi:predicted AlkP superfamily pyrophosphatase or phosphodiesterase